MAAVWAFLTIALLLAVVCGYLQGRRLRHGIVMAFGFAFYCTLPFAVYGLDLFEGGPGYALWGREFETAYKNSASVFLLFLVWVVSFVCGGFMPALKVGSGLDRPVSPAVLKLSFILLVLLWIWFIFQARGELFSGYGDEYRPDLMGPLATVNLLVTMLVLNMRQYAVVGWAWKAYLMLLVVNCVVLLSMGGRMYVMVSLVCLLLQHVNDHAREPAARLKVMILVFAGIFVLATVGVWRLAVDFDWRLVWITALAEPILTSISMGSYMDCGELDLVRAPLNFLGSIVNFVPSVFLPEKGDMLLSLDPAGRCLDSPFGATHIFSALLGNFGILGSIIFLFFFSWFLKTLLKMSNRGWWFYYYVCGLLPFMFYRDGFLIFNKVLFGTGLLLAVVLVAASRVRWSSLRRRSSVAVVFASWRQEV